MSAIVVFLIVLTVMLGAAIVAAAIVSGVLLAKEIRAGRPAEARVRVDGR